MIPSLKPQDSLLCPEVVFLCPEVSSIVVLLEYYLTLYLMLLLLGLSHASASGVRVRVRVTSLQLALFLLIILPCLYQFFPLLLLFGLLFLLPLPLLLMTKCPKTLFLILLTALLTASDSLLPHPKNEGC